MPCTHLYILHCTCYVCLYPWGGVLASKANRTVLVKLFYYYYILCVSQTGRSRIFLFVLDVDTWNIPWTFFSTIRCLY